MVTDVKDYTGKWFEAMSDGFKTVMEAGRSAQDSMFKAAGEWSPECGGGAPGELRDRSERLIRSWQPMMKRNADTAMMLFDANCKSGVEVAKASFDAMQDLDRGNAEDRTRRVWDASFGAINSSFNVLGTATKATMENLVDFCHSGCTPTGEPKSAAKKTK